jgi:5-methylcytosine-specific restriction protein A
MTYQKFLETGFWADIKYRKLELNPRCERCNSTRNIQVHHKVYRSWYKVQLSDLETLCQRCHEKAHAIA